MLIRTLWRCSPSGPPSSVGHGLDELGDSGEQLDAQNEQDENGENAKGNFDDFDEQLDAHDDQEGRNEAEERHSYWLLPACALDSPEKSPNEKPTPFSVFRSLCHALRTIFQVKIFNGKFWIF